MFNPTTAIERNARERVKKLTGKKRNRSVDKKGDKKPLKKPRGRDIPFNEELDLPVILKNAGCFRVYDPVLGLWSLYSSLTSQLMSVYTYPFPISPVKSKKGLGDRYVGGVPAPELVFSVLQQSFRSLYPNEDPARVMDWQPWKWSLTYYGNGHGKAMVHWQTLITLHECWRNYGGDKDPVTAKILRESMTQKSSFALPISHFLDKDMPHMKQEDLLKMRQEAEALASNPEFIEKVKADVALKKAENTVENSDDEESEGSVESETGYE